MNVKLQDAAEKWRAGYADMQKAYEEHEGKEAMETAKEQFETCLVMIGEAFDEFLDVDVKDLGVASGLMGAGAHVRNALEVVMSDPNRTAEETVEALCNAMQAASDQFLELAAQAVLGEKS